MNHIRWVLKEAKNVCLHQRKQKLIHSVVQKKATRVELKINKLKRRH